MRWSNWRTKLQWHLWWAWYPVAVGEKRVWLEWVERRVRVAEGEAWAEYRERK